MSSFKIIKNTAITSTSVERTNKRIDIQITKKEIKSLIGKLNTKKKKLKNQQLEYWKRKQHTHIFITLIKSDKTDNSSVLMCKLCGSESNGDYNE